MTWIEDAAEQFAKNDVGLNLCGAGHPTHDRRTIEVTLSGPCDAVPDYPAIPQWLEQHFLLSVYDWEKYEGVPMYCSGNDSVSQAIALQGVWEGFETLLAMDILGDARIAPSVMVDLGSHVGWYSIIAASFGYEVLAVDGDRENLELLNQSSRWNGFYNLITTSHGWIGPETTPLSPGPRIRLLKADVEGAEDEVLRICDPLFREGLIDFAFFEVSPEFSDHYPATVQSVLDHGYDAYLIPDKGTPIEEFSSDPLGYTLSTAKLTKADISDMTVQKNVVFVKS